MGLKNEIRVLALAILQRDDGKILLEKGRDTVKNEVFYRPLGGGVEFGEKGEQALIREFREEIDKVIEIEEALGTIENIFEWQGSPGHQIILLYRCAFVDPADYAFAHIPRVDGNPDHTYWRSISDIEAENAKLYPYGIAEFLTERKK